MSRTPVDKYKSLKIKLRKNEKEEPLFVRAFAEIMPEVKFIDVTPKAKVSTTQNFLPARRASRLGRDSGGPVHK